MPDLTNRFRQRLAAGTPIFGSWLMAGTPSTAEALGYVGFDFLVVDMEHTPIEVADLSGILRALAVAGTAPLVRLAWNDAVLIKRCLDAGAGTIMLPFIQSAEEARAAVRAAKYPPEGLRGVAAVHRASRYGQAKDYFARANGETYVIVQLETVLAVERLAEIAAVPGVDALFLGPADLAAAMGHIGNFAHPDVQDVIARAAQGARAAGKPIGIVGPNPQMVGRFVEYGYTFAAVASDLALMTGRAAEYLAALRGSGGASRPPGAAY